MTERTLEYVRLDKLKANPANPKDHDIGQINESMDRFGYVESVTVDERTGQIVSGHGRVKTLAAKMKAGKEAPDGIKVDDDGVWMIPVQRGWSSKDDVEAKAFLVAANRLTTLGGWNEEALTSILSELAEGPGLEGVGYDTEDLDRLLKDLETRDEGDLTEDPEDDELPTLKVDSVAQPGDVWEIAGHRIGCGNSADPDLMGRVLDGRAIDLVVTSPPYNSGINYNDHNDRTTGRDTFIGMLSPVVRNVVAHMADGRYLAWNIGVAPENYMPHQLAMIEAFGMIYRRQVVWYKRGNPLPTFHVTRKNPVARGYYPDWRHEMVYLFSNGDPIKGHQIAVPDDAHADVWEHIAMERNAGVPMSKEPVDRGKNQGINPTSTKAHPATFPAALPATILSYLTAGGELVFDPFLGAGTTIVAAHKHNRVGAGIELDPMYVDICLARLMKFTGESARNVDTGERFEVKHD